MFKDIKNKDSKLVKLIFFMSYNNVIFFLLLQVGSFETMRGLANIIRQVLRSSADRDALRHVSRDLDFSWHRNAKRFTLVNPSISGYHSGSRSRD